MKRGWITWDQTELPRAAFDARLDAARTLLRERDLEALVVYTDIWRSNRVRHFCNFMPYWNRALLAIPREAPPVLLCGLSPRVYPWIQSVTILEEILPSPNLPQRLVQLGKERRWARIGAVDLAGFPNDLYTPLKAAGVEDLGTADSPDEWELALHRRAATMAREGLDEELASGIGQIDHEFTGLLERKFRRAGAEDLVILLTNGRTPPAPPRGERLGEAFSVSLALEYRGHWVKLIRNPVGQALLPAAAFQAAGRAETRPQAGGLPHVYTETLGGPYPYESGDGPLFAARWESAHNGLRLFHGDTYRRTPNGPELL